MQGLWNLFNELRQLNVSDQYEVNSKNQLKDLVEALCTVVKIDYKAQSTCKIMTLSELLENMAKKNTFWGKILLTRTPEWD